MRPSIALPLLGVLALAACKKEAVVATDESAESVAKKVAAANVKPQPGRWESTMKFGRMDMPDMPPEAKAAFDKQLGTAQTFTTCLTPEEVDRPDAGFFQKGADSCKYDHFVMADGRLDAAMTCKEAGQDMKMTMSGSYSRTNYAISVKTQGEIQRGMPMSMEMSIAARRVGECNGSEKG